MGKTIEIDKTDLTKIKVGDRLTLVGSGNTYTITAVDASDRFLPVKVNALEGFREIVMSDWGADAPLELWVTPDRIERITREVDAPELPTPTRNNTAYLGADGAIYVYTRKNIDDMRPWCRLSDGDCYWFSSHELARFNSDELPLRELKPIENEEES